SFFSKIFHLKKKKKSESDGLNNGHDDAHDEKKENGNEDDNDNTPSLRQFGVPIKSLAQTDIPHYDAPIPSVLVTLGTWLFETQGHLIEGIFRKQPDVKECDRIKDLLNLGKANEIQVETLDPLAIANLIKVWFRELPDSLLHPIGMQTIEQSQSTSKFVASFQTIPEPNKSIFLWLLDLCAEVAACQSTNQMNPQ
ncbi:hypothetical protein RFI_33211, partial [Reticulomyxa filosa]